MSQVIEEVCIKAIKNQEGNIELTLKGDIDELRNILFNIIETVSQVLDIDYDYINDDEEADKITIH